MSVEKLYVTLEGTIYDSLGDEKPEEEHKPKCVRTYPPSPFGSAFDPLSGSEEEWGCSSRK